MRQPVVVVFEHSAAAAEAICEQLHGENVSLRRSTSLASLFAMLSARCLVILGPSVARTSSLIEVGQAIRRASHDVTLLVVAAQGSEELAVAALRAGAHDYVRYPLLDGELSDAVRRCVEVGGDEAPREASGKTEMPIIGDGPAMRDLKERLKRMAATNSTILITGETGTGKELVAEQMHRGSPRSKRPFVRLNCSAIPDGLLESELFGYEKGAFTGAMNRQEGKIKAADGGSVFLDEIGEMSPYGQAKLLRVIEGKEIQRLGRNDGMAVDIRIIAATNQDLEEMVAEGKFRRDLFFRLNVGRIHLPPLRERKEDVTMLIQHYIHHFNGIFGRKVEGLSDEAMAILSTHGWPGNVREVKNLIEAVFIELSSDEERYPHLPLRFRSTYESLRCVSGDERDKVLWALNQTNWNKSEAACKLHWSRMTLYRKMAQYQISNRQ